MAVRAPTFMIMGTARSGTTLVQRLAAELPGVAVPPETHFFSHFARPLLDSGRLPLAGGDLRAALVEYTQIPSCRGLDLDVGAVVERLEGRAASVWELFAAIVGTLAGPAEVVGEKTPDHLLWWRPITQVWPELRLVLVVRDPRAVVASNLGVPFGMSSPLLLAERWVADVRLVRLATEELGGRALLVRYEDVVADPSGTRGQLAEHLGVDVLAPGVPAAPRYLEWEAWKGRVDQAITPERVSSWTGSLSAPVAALVTDVCRGAMPGLGYDPLPLGASPPRPGPGDLLRRARYRTARRRSEAAIARVGT